MKGFMLAGVKSGCGKTTVTCAVLSAFRAKGLKTAAFKCGPDYIDPMFHRETAGARVCNLDSYFCDENTVRYLLGSVSEGCDVSVIEGVMGFYDGGEGSAYNVSRITGAPVVIVVDCKGMSESIGAVVSGYLNYRKPNNIAGFIFSRLPARLAPMAKELCGELGTEYFGYLPQCEHTIDSRHLGLVTPDEIDGIESRLAALGELAQENILTDRLAELEIGLPAYQPPVIPVCGRGVRIAVARDMAFCFIYEENMRLLEEMGCEIEFFSPLDDSRVPDADGMILCGGYPELYAERLSQNTEMLSDIKERIFGGMPTIAECGGFMYLHERIETKEGKSYPMAGVIGGSAYWTGKLGRFGYAEMTAESGGLLLGKGGKLRIHEFHYFDSNSCGDSFTAVKPDGRQWRCGHSSGSLYAGFPHIYFFSDITAAERFVRACAAYGGAKDEHDS
ncbi:MAG: cobyrinate a,c-diamide synthase [Ruminococcus sp.]|nr:cobyrinate a,c-diamide synthase [Ruminococcus sp.]